MAVSVMGQTLVEPAFITYLLNPEVTHDFYFVVRNQQSGQTEKVGAVKTMLMAHSEVLRSELGDSPLAMKQEANLEDIFSNTLRNLLKYVYGYDIIATLSFDDADNLLYVAEKYMIAPLKNKLAARLMSLLNYDNICSLINNPACFRHLELNNEITKILQFKTSKVFASTQFLEISSAAFVKILEQDRMNVEEIEVWRAALKWAKHKVASEEGAVLRAQLSEHLKYIRFCTLSTEDLSREVLPSHVLENDEFCLVCTSVGQGQKQSKLKNICNNIKRRNKKAVLRRNKTADITTATFSYIFQGNFVGKESTFKIYTKNFGIELLPLVFKARSSTTGSVHTYHVDTTVCITNISVNIGTQNIKFSQEVTYGENFSVPVITNMQNVQLLPNSTYEIRLVFSEEVSMCQGNDEIIFNNYHIAVVLEKSLNDYNSSCYYSHIDCIKYRLFT